MPVSRNRHSTSPRTHIIENLTFGDHATIKIGDPFAGHAPGWKDLVGQIVVKGVGESDPTWSAIPGLGGLFGFSFSPTFNKEVWLVYHIDHDYAMGTSIFFHTHWMNAEAIPNTGNVRWGFEYSVAKGHQQQTFSAPTTVYALQGSNSNRHMHHIAEVSISDALSSERLEPDSLILVRIFRDAASVLDTCTDSVFLLTADCHYQAAQFASKNKSPDFFA